MKNKPQAKEWLKGLDNLTVDACPHVDKEALKEFIQNLLDQQKKELREKVEGMIDEIDIYDGGYSESEFRNKLLALLTTGEEEK